MREVLMTNLMIRSCVTVSHCVGRHFLYDGSLDAASVNACGALMARADIFIGPSFIGE
jgi:hypothetical protein